MRNIKIFVTLISCVVLVTMSCVTSNESNSIIISGKLNESIKLKDGKFLYLFDAAEKGVVKDSTKVKDGMFEFVLNGDTALTPFKARICYWDSIKDEKALKYLKQDSILNFLRPIGFYNPYDTNYIESYFYVDYGINEIKPFRTNTATLNGLHQIEENKQNEPFFKHKSLHISKDTNYSDDPIISKNAELISEYQQSFFLLNQLFRTKELFKLKDLKYLISLFDNKLNAVSIFSPYLSYISSADKPQNILSSISLENQNGQRGNVLSSKYKNKLVIFWASWCAPCRAEIPLLKKLFSQKHELEMISISIDDNHEHWKEALVKENMPWRQYVVGKEDKTTIDLIFKIHSIPFICLIDSSNNIKKTISGFSDSTFETIVNAIATKSPK